MKTALSICWGQGRPQPKFKRLLWKRTANLHAWLKVSKLILFFAFCRVSTPMALAQVSFGDSVFDQADWDITFFAHPQPPSGGSAIQVLGPGPNFFQRVEHVLGGTPTPSEVLSVHINLQAAYAPRTSCPIGFINYSEQARTLSTEPGTFGAATGPALRQGGRLYIANLTPTRIDFNGSLPSPFIPRTFTNLTASDFSLVLGAGSFDNSQHPDFSTNGSLIEFGFARFNSHIGSTNVTRVTAIDDWTVFVQQLVPAEGDFGDAPDGSLGMETGYYGFTSAGGLVFTLTSQSGPAFFQTVRTNLGPFTLTNDLFIAPLPPSLESDANGPIDADAVFNLNPLADDPDNDFADGGGAQVLIFAFSPRPPALFFTLAARTTNGPTSGFWNALFDLDQDGDWGPGEQVCRDIPFGFGASDVVLLSSPFFAWGPPGAQFGRLTFPVWARNMVTSELVGASTPFSAPSCGFDNGEVEDYFVEWFPIGPMPDDPPDELVFGADIPTEHLASFSGPAGIPLGQQAEYAISGPPLNKLTVVYLPNVATGGVAGPRFELSAESRFGGIETEELVAEAELTPAGDKLRVTMHKAPENATLVVYGEPVDRGIVGPGVPSSPNRTPTFGAAMILVQDAPRVTTVRVENNQVYIQWTGGKAPYHVQRVNRLGDAWTDVLTTQGTTATLPVSGPTGYFRILGNGG